MRSARDGKVACLALFALIACATIPRTPAPVWQEEFDGPAGASYDRTKWAPDTGGHGFGNKERQFHTSRRENVALDGNGHLVITARAEPQPSTYTCWYGSCRYTSARFYTHGLFAQAYGRFEARLKLPRGQGIWPAFWMLGANTFDVGWPDGGEIDIMEHIGREPRVVYGTLHGPGYSGAKGISRGDTIASGTYADEFHVFSVSWRPNEIRWFVDGREYHRLTPANLPPGTRWVFDHPFFLILNLAVGGEWPGDPDATSTFPQQLIVDYVRVYRDP